MRTRTLKNLFVMALAAFTVVISAACGDDDTPTTVELPEAIDRPEAGDLEADVVVVGSAPFYFAGFAVEVVEAAVDPEAGTVEVDLSVENLSAEHDVVFPADELMLVWDGEMTAGFLGEIGEVFSGTSRNLSIGFRVDDTFSFDGAVLAGGSPGDIRPTVDLFPPFAVEAFAPVELVVPDPETDGDLTVAVTAMQLQGYEPAAFSGRAPSQQAEDTPILVVPMTLTSTSDARTGANFSSSSYRLKLPDGTTRGAVAGDIAVLDPGVSIDVTAAFELPDVVLDPQVLGEGTYELVVTDDRGLDSEVVLAFTLEAAGNDTATGP